MRRRIVSLFMALALCLSLLPTAAFAAEDEPAEQPLSQEQVISAPEESEEQQEPEAETPAKETAQLPAAAAEAVNTAADGEHSHCVCGAVHKATGAHTAENPVTWTGVDALTNDMAAGNYYLTADVELSSMWQPQNDIVLCLNGHTITAQASGAVINMSAAGTSLTLTDCAPEGVVGKVTHKDNKTGSGVYVAKNGTFTLYGGSITGNDAGRGNGGGVYVGDGTFNMRGGSISGNAANDLGYGGGVHVYGGTFNMSGGSISGNNAEYDGGVFVESGTFNMSGGSITGNNANNGGGVYVNTNGTFTMSGGSITGNNAVRSYNYGGGVVVKGTFELEDGSITGNYAGGTLNTESGLYEKGATGKDSNVFLPAGKTIGVSELGATGGTIGVTTEVKPAANNPVAITARAYQNQLSRFVSDEGYYPVYDATSRKIQLEKNPPHVHYLCGGGTCTQVGHDQEDGTTTFKAWSKTTSLPSADGNYYLTEDVTLSSTWTLQSPVKNVVLCLNGHTIKTTGDDTGVITVMNGNRSLTLTDCEPEGKTGTVTHEAGKTGRGVYVSIGSTFTLYGGSITGNKTANHYGGGGVLVYGGTFNMCGGSVSGNEADSNGGGVYVYGRSSKFTMYGGSISGNNANGNGGGVYVNDSSSKFTMYGGSISGNNTNGYYGGGVDVKDGTFKLQNGSITENYANGTRNEGSGLYEKGENGTDSNVYLRSGKTIDASGLEADAGEIGVTTQDTPADGSPVAIAAGAKDGVDYSAIFTPDVKDKDYTITSSGENVYLTVHTHRLTYSVSSDGATITAACSDCGKSGSVTVNAPAELTYDGSDKAATVTESSWLGDAVTITYKQGETTLTGVPVNAGTYTAGITAGGETASVTFTIQPKTVTPTVTVAGGSVYDGTAKQPAVTVKDGDTKIDAGEYTVSYSNNINAGIATVTVTDKDGGNYAFTAVNETFSIGKAEQTISVPAGKSVIRNGKAVDISRWASAEGALTYALDGTYSGIELSGSKLTAEPTAAVTEITIAVTAAATDNYNAAAATFTVAIIAKKAANVTVTGLPAAVACGDVIALTASQTGDSGSTDGKWSWSYDHTRFQLVEANGTAGTLKLRAVEAGNTETSITAAYESSTHQGSASVTVSAIGKKVLRQSDLNGIPAALTKTYDAKNTHTATVWLTLKDDAKIRDNEQTKFGVSADQIIYGSSDVGETTAVLSLSGINLGPNYEFAGGFTGITVPAEITRRAITVTGAAAVDRGYETANKAVDVDVTFGNLPDGVTLVKGTDYDVAGTMADANAGVDKKVDVTVTLKSKNYSISVNYTTTKATIWQANAPVLSVSAISQRWNDTAAKEITPHWNGIPADAGSKTFSILETVLPEGVTMGSNYTMDAATGKLTYAVTGATAAHAGQSITLKVHVAMENYQETDVILVIQLLNRHAQSDFKFAEGARTVTYGDAAFTVTAAGNAAGSTVTYASSNEAVATVDNTGKVTVKGAGTATITATAGETADYNAATATYALTVQPKTLTKDDLTYSGAITKVYDTTAAAPADLRVTVKAASLVGSDTLTVSGALAYNSAKVSEANAITFTPDAITDGNYRLAASEVLTISGARITKATPACTAPAGLTAKYGQTLADVTLPAGWSWMSADLNVGIIGTNTFKARFTPADTVNYRVVENIDVSVTVGKADARILKDIPASQKYTVTGEQSVQLGSIMPADAGTLTYAAGSPSVSGTATVTAFFVDNSGLVKFTITGGAAGAVITLPVTVSSANYADSTVNVKITLLAREDQATLTVNGGKTVAFGETLTFTADGGSGTGSITYSVTNGTGEATIDAATGVLTPVKVGTVKVKATRAGDAEFNDADSAELEITITQAAATGEPNYTKITTGGKTLADARLTISGGTLNLSAGTLEWIDDEGNVLPDTTVVERNTTYKWRFTPADTNYAVLTGSVELYHVSSSGGSSYPAGLTFRSGLPAGTINKVTVNGKTLSSRHYVINGSDVTLLQSYLDTLKAGKYTVRIENTTHVSTGTFTINGNGQAVSPRTFDAGIAVYAAMAVASMTGMAWLGKKKED